MSDAGLLGGGEQAVLLLNASVSSSEKKGYH